ncbi:hypothetical protein J7E32_19450, partial [Bacillus sp. ISL-55]|nr:hypothetical protein [Bacillus sp. ISL-55]
IAKSHQVRTKGRLRLMNLSEVAPGSDKRPAPSHEFVRSHTRFGQKAVSVSRICPKSHQVRTKGRLRLMNLSEVAPGSDKRPAPSHEFVRSRTRFGQNTGSISRICPK